MLHDKTELQPSLNWQLFWCSSTKLVAFLGVFFQAWYVDFPLPGNFYVCACEGTPSASSKYYYYYDPCMEKESLAHRITGGGVYSVVRKAVTNVLEGLFYTYTQVHKMHHINLLDTF